MALSSQTGPRQRISPMQWNGSENLNERNSKTEMGLPSYDVHNKERSRPRTRRRSTLVRCFALLFALALSGWVKIGFLVLHNNNDHDSITESRSVFSWLNIKEKISEPRIVLLAGSLQEIDVVRTSDIAFFEPRNERDDDNIIRYLQPNSHQRHTDHWYEKNMVELQDEETDCPFIADWQKTFVPNPTCNIFHELGITVTTDKRVPYRLKYLDEGSFKQVWQPLLENGEPAPFVLKTTQMGDYSEDDLLGDQQDAVTMERNTKSDYFVTMYSYCHFSNLVERARGTLGSWIRKNRQKAKSIELLRVANMLSQGVKDMHMYTESHEGNLLPTLAHADIKASQFLEISPGHFKLNDCNRGRFLTSADGKSICPFYMPGIRHNGSTMRAPEEYESNSGQDDKIDVFSLGSSLYHLLSGSPPFHEENFGDAVKFIKKGVELELPDHVKDDPTLAHIVKAIILCRQKDPKKRPFSREIASDLKKALKEVEEEA